MDGLQYFAKNFMVMHDGKSIRAFNERELKGLKEMEQMMGKGYELKFVHLRQGTRMMWCKLTDPSKP